MNNIYRIGYFILTFGILFDILLQIAMGMPVNGVAFRPVELAVLLIANFACLVLMIRKGLGRSRSLPSRALLAYLGASRAGISAGLQRTQRMALGNGNRQPGAPRTNYRCIRLSVYGSRHLCPELYRLLSCQKTPRENAGR